VAQETILLNNQFIPLQSRQQHILDVTVDPLGQWLACACLDGAVYLVPVMALMLVL